MFPTRSPSRNFQLLMQGQNFGNVIEEIARNEELFEASKFRQNFKGSPFTQTCFIPCRMTYDLDHEPTEDELIEHLKTKGVTNVNAVDTDLYQFMPETYSVVMWLAGLVQAEQIGRVLVARCNPTGHIGAHKDFGAYHDFYDRFHICLSGEGCHFRSGREIVKMLPGEIWWFWNNDEHEVWNDSDKPRDHIVIDFKLKGDKHAFREV